MKIRLAIFLCFLSLSSQATDLTCRVLLEAPEAEFTVLELANHLKNIFKSPIGNIQKHAKSFKLTNIDASHHEFLKKLECTSFSINGIVVMVNFIELTGQLHVLLDNTTIEQFSSETMLQNSVQEEILRILSLSPIPCHISLDSKTVLWLVVHVFGLSQPNSYTSPQYLEISNKKLLAIIPLTNRPTLMQMKIKREKKTTTLAVPERYDLAKFSRMMDILCVRADNEELLLLHRGENFYRQENNFAAPPRFVADVAKKFAEKDYDYSSKFLQLSQLKDEERVLGVLWAIKRSVVKNDEQDNAHQPASPMDIQNALHLVLRLSVLDYKNQ